MRRALPALRLSWHKMLDDRFYSVAPIAELFALNPQRVRNWVDEGSLPAIRIGSRRVRIRESDLERFIAESTATAPSK